MIVFKHKGQRIGRFINREQAENYLVNFLVDFDDWRSDYFSYVIEDIAVVPAYNAYLLKKKDVELHELIGRSTDK